MLDNWSAEKFTQMCIFAGTDYKEPDTRIKGFGLKTAHKLLKDFPSADKMLTWMHTDKKWEERFPCALEEYTQRFTKVNAVFFHHIAFDPRIGECVSIARSFPHADRSFPGMNLVELCGTGPLKEHAGKVFRGAMMARTLGPRPVEALTPVERRTLDSIMARKRSEQRQYHFEQSLKADAAQIAATQQAASASRQPGSIFPQASGAAATSPQQASVEDADDAALEALLAENDVVPAAPRAISLRPGEAQALFAIFDEVSARRENDVEVIDDEPMGGGSAGGAVSSCSSQPPSFNSSDASQKANSFASPKGNSFASQVIDASPPATSSQGATQSGNPFARKRPGDAVPFVSSQASKTIRTIGARSGSGGSNIFARRDVRPVASPIQKSEPRFLAAPMLGKRGGSAAMDAAQTVLAQKGMAELAPLPAHKDKTKLTGFFKHHQQPLPVKPQATAPKSTLADWKSRPWEVEEEEPDTSAVSHYENPLSMKSNPCRGALYMKQGW